MKLSNNKRQLAEIIRVSGNEWLTKYTEAMQDGNGVVFAYGDKCKPCWVSETKLWDFPGGRDHFVILAFSEPISQCHCTKLTRDEYMHYLSEFETPNTIETLIKSWSDLRDEVNRLREQLTVAEQVERDAHARVEAALAAAGWGGARDDDEQDPSTWKVGDQFEVIGKTGKFHHYDVGDIVTMIELYSPETGTPWYSRDTDGFRQYVLSDDLRKL